MKNLFTPTPSLAPTPARYHPALVTLHWLLALLIFVALFMGTWFLKEIPNSSPEKLWALKGHMVAGALILLLTLLRLAVRLKTAHPAPASSGNALLDRLAPLMHGGLYVLVLGMAGSGIAISVLAGLPETVFLGVGQLPVNFDHLLPRTVHGGVAKLLMLAVGLHVAAGFYHHFVRRDGLLHRMGLGKR